MTTYEWITVFIFSISAIIALIMVGLAISQLKELTKQVKSANESNTLSRLMALLSLEDSIAERRLSLSEAGIDLTEQGKKAQSNSAVYKDSFEIAHLRFNEAKQMYLNGLDRLCFCLNKGFLIEEDLRAEYRDIITRAVNDFPDDFKTNTQYRNVKKIYEKWADN